MLLLYHKMIHIKGETVPSLMTLTSLYIIKHNVPLSVPLPEDVEEHLKFIQIMCSPLTLYSVNKNLIFLTRIRNTSIFINSPESTQKWAGKKMFIMIHKSIITCFRETFIMIMEIIATYPQKVSIYNPEIMMVYPLEFIRDR